MGRGQEIGVDRLWRARKRQSGVRYKEKLEKTELGGIRNGRGGFGKSCGQTKGIVGSGEIEGEAKTEDGEVSWGCCGDVKVGIEKSRVRLGKKGCAVRG